MAPKLIRVATAFTVTTKLTTCTSLGKTMNVYDWNWLTYDTVAFAVLMIALGGIELLALSI